MKYLLFFCLFFFTLSSLPAQKKSFPQRVIFDTDMGPDYDDAGAIAELHALADRSKINILATMASTKLVFLTKKNKTIMKTTCAFMYCKRYEKQNRQ